MKASTIVVIDDEADILELLKYNFEKEKALVRTFTSGSAALHAIRKEAPDAIVCDWMLDDVEGLEICRQIKLNPALRHIPFVMLTAKGDEIDVVTALEMGADDYLVKPIRVKELISRLKKILNRGINPAPTGTAAAEEMPANQLQFKALTIDIDKHRVFLEDDLIELTYAEFKLLQLLVSRPGKVFSRSQIIEKLNGLDYFATERSVDVQVVGLRKKIGPYKDYLETVRGIGYRFQD